MTWEDLRRILGLPGNTPANPFSPSSNAALNCSQEWGGEGLGRLKMKHGEGGLGKVKTNHEMGFGGFHGSQEWNGKGLGRLKMKHGEGVDRRVI